LGAAPSARESRAREATMHLVGVRVRVRGRGRVRVRVRV
jgi:hypothetical protein